MEVASPNTDVLLTRVEKEEEVMLASFFCSTLLVDDNGKGTGLYVFVLLSGVHCWDLIGAG